MFISGVVVGKNKIVKLSIIKGKIIFFFFDIVWSCGIWILCFVCVVSVCIIGGWIIGISVIYE